MRRPIANVLTAVVLASCGGATARPDGGPPGHEDAAREDAARDDAARDDAARDDAAALDAGTEPPLVRSTDFAEGDDEAPNPERGFYWWDWNEDASLVLVKVQLGAHCAQPTLPATLLDDVRARLARHRDAGRRAIVRFVYADDGVLNACGLADAASIDVVIGHVAQLEPIFREHVDVIAYVEAGFFGMWGEWNMEHAPAGTSLVADAENRRRLVRALLDVVPAERAILVRRPRFRDELPFAEADLARIGFHDDCFLASADDYGTYDGARTVDEWKDYVAAATTRVPFGAETCVDASAYTSCDHAVAEMERLRVSYVHEGYLADVIDRWRTEGCLPEIRRRLGHRVVVRAVSAPVSVAAGGVLRVRLELENVGFAPPYTTRRMRIVLRDGTDAIALEPREAPDTRGWAPGAIAPFDLVVDLPADLAPGEREIRLVLLEDRSDAPAYAMMLANDARVRDDARRENVLARVTVE